MSKFIELSDYDASMHRDILEATTRKDDAIVEICEDRAIEEMRCYLSKRYDCDPTFLTSYDGSVHGVPGITRWQPRRRVALVMALKPTPHGTS